MKQCFKCKAVKDRSEFYAHPQMGDGLLGKCKACTRRDSEARRAKKEANDPEWVKNEKERHRKKNKTMYHEHPIIGAARNAVRKLGRTKEYHWHHWSYRKEHHVDVIQLLPNEHRKAHRFLVYDQEHFQYRRSDTLELLDTRERHEAFIRHMIATKED